MIYNKNSKHQIQYNGQKFEKTFAFIWFWIYRGAESEFSIGFPKFKSQKYKIQNSKIQKFKIQYKVSKFK